MTSLKLVLVHLFHYEYSNTSSLFLVSYMSPSWYGHEGQYCFLWTLWETDRDFKNICKRMNTNECFKPPWTSYIILGFVSFRAAGDNWEENVATKICILFYQSPLFDVFDNFIFFEYCELRCFYFSPGMFHLWVEYKLKSLKYNFWHWSSLI